MQHQTLIIVTNQKQIVVSDLSSVVDEVFHTHLNSSDHPDLHVLNSENKAIGIATIKELIDWAAKKPFQAEHKLAIILNSESLTPEAQNSLLKTLEEPSPNTLICLVTSNPASLLNTILSRGKLTFLQDEYNLDLDPKQQSRVAEFITGNMITKLAIVDQISSEENRKFALEFIEALARELIARRIKFASAKLNGLLENCKLAYVGVKAGTNLKLTLSALAISIYTS